MTKVVQAEEKKKEQEGKRTPDEPKKKAKKMGRRERKALEKKHSEVAFSQFEADKGFGGMKDYEYGDIFDISREVELMREIKDIRDELNILHTLFGQQAALMNSAMKWDESPRSRKLKDAVERLQENVERMERNAERPHRAVRIQRLAQRCTSMG